MIKKFNLIQKFRNKIRIKDDLNIEISKSAKIVGCTLSSKGKNNSFIVNDNAVLRNVNIEILGDNCSIYIGKDCMIGDKCYLSAKEGSKLTILDNCMLSRNIKIMTSDGHPIYQNEKRINFAKDITLKENVWVADNVTILKGVTVESDSIIGINATLTKSIPSNAIAVGNPAKVVKTNVTWKE